MSLPGRQKTSEDYRFGFGGHEKDDEVKGDGNHLSFGDYGYDTRLGRRWNVDPKAAEALGWSPYRAFFNNPVFFIDPDGKFEMESYTDEQLGKMDLNRNDYDRFKNIVDNISNIVKDNPTALDEICATTGFDRETVLKDLAKGGRVKVSIQRLYDENGDERSGRAEASIDGIFFSPDIIKYLGGFSISSGNSVEIESLTLQVLGIALTVLHEYGHYGDQVTNDGKNSGQYNPIWAEAPRNQEYALRLNYKYNKKTDIMEGKGDKQRKITLTGHRGTDIEMNGFGLEFTGGNKRLSIRNGDESKLQPEAQRSNILRTLKITK